MTTFCTSDFELSNELKLLPKYVINLWSVISTLQMRKLKVKEVQSFETQTKVYLKLKFLFITTLQCCFCLWFPWWRSGWESVCQCRGHGFEPCSGKIPHAAEQLSPCATTTEPMCNNYGSPCAKIPCSATREAWTPHQRVAPARCN